MDKKINLIFNIFIISNAVLLSVFSVYVVINPQEMLKYLIYIGLVAAAILIYLIHLIQKDNEVLEMSERINRVIEIFVYINSIALVLAMIYTLSHPKELRDVFPYVAIMGSINIIYTLYQIISSLIEKISNGRKN